MDGLSGLSQSGSTPGKPFNLVGQTIAYDYWNTPETIQDRTRRVFCAYYWIRAREWRDSVRLEYVQACQALWKQSLGSDEDSIKPFLSEVQGIIDEKITTGESYDKEGYRTYLRLKGLVNYAPRQQITAEDVKSKVQMQDLAGRYVELRKSGSNFVCRCPFHDDKHPSAIVYTKSNTFKCFSCGEYHDVIGFLMKISNITFLEALNQLSNNI